MESLRIIESVLGYSGDFFSALALEGGACEAGGPGPHGGFLLLRMITSVSGKFRHITDKTLTKNLRIVNKRFKNRIKHLKIVKILIS